MAIRIVGVDLPQNKRGEIALTYVYAVSYTHLDVYKRQALRYVLSVSPNRIKVKVLSLLVKKFVESLVNLPALSNLHKIRML